MLKELGNISRVIQAFRRYDSKMPIQTMDLFVQIAMRPEGVSLIDIEKRLELKSSSMTRNLFALGDREYKLNDGSRKQGLGLVHAQEDPTDFRRNILKLTKEGSWRLLSRSLNSSKKRGGKIHLVVQPDVNTQFGCSTDPGFRR